MKKPPVFFYPLAAAGLTALVYVIMEILMSSGSSAISIAAVLNMIGGMALLFSLGPESIFSSLKELSKSPLKLLLASVLGFAFSRLLEVSAIGLAGASKIAVLAQLETPFVLLLAVLLLGERPGSKKVLYGALIMVGAFITNFQGTDGLHVVFGLGEIFGVIFPLVYAFAIILLTDLIGNKKIEPRAVTGCAMILGALMLLPFIFSRGGFSSLLSMGPIAFVILLFAGLLQGANWLAYNLGLKHVGASITAMLYASTPIFTFIVSLFALALVPGRMHVPENPQFLIAGMLLIIAGTAMLASKTD